MTIVIRVSCFIVIIRALPCHRRNQATGHRNFPAQSYETFHNWLIEAIAEMREELIWQQAIAYRGLLGPGVTHYSFSQQRFTLSAISPLGKARQIMITIQLYARPNFPSTLKQTNRLEVISSELVIWDIVFYCAQLVIRYLCPLIISVPTKWPLVITSWVYALL